MPEWNVSMTQFWKRPRLESEATPEISEESEDEGVTQPWNRPVNFLQTQTPAGVKSLIVGTPGSKDS